MRFSYFDDKRITESAIEKKSAELKTYRNRIAKVVRTADNTKPEYSLVSAQDQTLHAQLDEVRKNFKNLKHVILVGVGGSSLGLEALHAVLYSGGAVLHTLDTVSVSEMDQVLKVLKRVKDVQSIGVCIISKSGSTAETLTNADVLMQALEVKFGTKLYKQTVCIGNADTNFLRAYKKRGASIYAMPEVVGGRFSVSTAVGLVPLTMLGHDTDAVIGGIIDSNNEEFEEITANAAVRIALYLNKKFVHYNFFAFETRLVKLGEWYRQLFAESLGKATDKKRHAVKGGMVPTISTPVELHSVGQLYLSGFAGVYTDFVTFDDIELDFTIEGNAPASAYQDSSMQEVATAIYGGVIGAYQAASLPYRSLIFTEDLAYSLGLFMGMRMREVMYIAHLRNLNAFDQPNVESYKKITKKILGT